MNLRLTALTVALIALVGISLHAATDHPAGADCVICALCALCPFC